MRAKEGTSTEYRFPFGKKLHKVEQCDTDKSKKEYFVLGVYASAVHAKWVGPDGKTICRALAVASEPCIFWNGCVDEAQEIIGSIEVPKELGSLSPADARYNGPSGRALDEHILRPLGISRREAWLCDLLPESRINCSQNKVIIEKYDPMIKQLNLGKEYLANVPLVPSCFCNQKRCNDITEELRRSGAKNLITLGDDPIKQYLSKVELELGFSDLKEYTANHSYGSSIPITIGGISLNLFVFVHPRQIAALGYHSKDWRDIHKEWEAGKTAEEYSLKD